MEEQEQHNMEVRMEIEDLKGSITQLTEMLQVLIARGAEPQRTVIGEVTEAIEDPIPVQRPPSSWPEFGLPHNYSLPYEKALEAGPSTQEDVQIPVITEQPPIIHTTVQPPFPNPPFTYPVDNSQHGDQEQNNEVEDVKEKYNVLEKRLKVVEGNDIFGFDTMNLCLVPDLTIPAKVKVPEFEKYKGHTCPKDHLTMYFRKIAAYANDDKLLIHYFQDSLTGASMKWYMSLKKDHIQTWRDLGEAFLKQYKYNMDLAPDRRQLQTLTIGDRETFKVYDQRWRDLAAQNPRASFAPYYTYLYVATSQQPYIPMPAHQQPWNASQHNASTIAPQNSQQNHNGQQNQNRPQKKKPRRIDPIMMTYT
ncbi:uncharacterized protein LOC131628351 [Vicia villosa]|uniref:uncharacterized protein LOC131628351 n=1 Tax=Vicia villosa TaxID=3911 RepID=UPI00273BA012|nr:uncharacterized protein LOC131628351 [Vicia villosa]